MKRLSSYLFSLLIVTFFSFGIYNEEINAAYDESAVGTYEEELANFPDSYKSKIVALHEIYPNAVFVAQDVFFDWNAKKEVSVDWNRMIESEYTTDGRSLLYYTLEDGYKSVDSWAYSYYTNKYTAFSGGKWNAASKATIAYYLDSRNFLNETHIFMFESLLYHDYQTVSGVEEILSGTFMSDRYCPGSTKKYSEVIMDAAKQNNISAYMLASRLRQEQGTKGTSSLISGTYSGYEGYYNYFNVQASGDSDTDVIVNGLKYAQSQGWDSPYKAIVGGASFIKKEYVGINDSYNVKGQLTLYLQKWDPYGWKLGGHQYMQNITAPKSESETTYSSYASVDDYKNYNYVFYIPIYSNMPSQTSLPNSGNPNNWLSNLTVNGATVSGFDSGNTSYTINVSDSTDSVNIDYVKVANTSSVKGAGNITLINQSTEVNIVVTAQNGDVNTYKLTINKDSSAGIAVSEIVNSAGIKSDGTYLSGINVGTTVDTLKNKFTSVTNNVSVTIKNSSGSTKNGVLCTGDIVTIKSGNETKSYSIVIYGDVNGDGSIKASDYVFIKNYIMGTKSLSGANLKAADVNKDGSIKASDYVLIKNNIMGKYSLTQ